MSDLTRESPDQSAAANELARDLQTQRPVSASETRIEKWLNTPRIVQIATTHAKSSEEQWGIQTLTALASDGRIFETTDTGATWREITGPKL